MKEEQKKKLRKLAKGVALGGAVVLTGGGLVLGWLAIRGIVAVLEKWQAAAKTPATDLADDNETPLFV